MLLVTFTVYYRKFIVILIQFYCFFKACDRSKNYLNSWDSKNNAFFMIYLLIQIDGMVVPTFNNNLKRSKKISR